MADDRLKLSRTIQPREVTSTRPATERPAEFPRPRPDEVAQVKEAVFRDPERQERREAFREIRREIRHQIREERRENQREIAAFLRETQGIPDKEAAPAPAPEREVRERGPRGDYHPEQEHRHDDGHDHGPRHDDHAHFERAPTTPAQKAELLEKVTSSLAPEAQHPGEVPHEAHAPGGEPRAGLLRTDAGQVPQQGGEAHLTEAPHQEPLPLLANKNAPQTPGQPVPQGKPEGGTAHLGEHLGDHAAPAPHGEAAGPPPKPVSKLVPDLKKLTQAEEVPNRFLKDLVAARSPLLDSALPKEQRASRLFGFFSHYAERFVALAKGFPDNPQSWGPTAKNNPPVPTGPALPQSKKDTAVEQFLGNLREVGFSQLRDRTTGNTGLQTAKQMLEAESPRDVQRQARDTALVVVGREGGGGSLSRGSDTALGQPQFNPDGGIINNRRPDSPQDWEDERRRRRREHKVLGSNMLWNILHLERNPNETMSKDGLNRLAFGAILVLVGVTLMVVLLVNLN